MGNVVTVPEAVTNRTALLGQRVRRARLRRGLSIPGLAAKVGINRNTLAAIELGKPGITLAAFTATLWALGLDATMDGVADPDTDLHGKTLEASRAPKRAGKTASDAKRYDF